MMPRFRHKQTGQIVGVDESSSRAPVLRNSPDWEEVDTTAPPPQAEQSVDAWAPGPADRERLEDEPKAVLLTYAANRGLHDVKSHWTKVEIIDALMESD